MQDHLDFTDNCCCIEMKLLAGKAYSNSGTSNQNIKAAQMSYSSIPAQLEITRLISTFCRKSHWLLLVVPTEDIENKVFLISLQEIPTQVWTSGKWVSKGFALNPFTLSFQGRNPPTTQRYLLILLLHYFQLLHYPPSFSFPVLLPLHIPIPVLVACPTAREKARAAWLTGGKDCSSVAPMPTFGGTRPVTASRTGLCTQTGKKSSYFIKAGTWPEGYPFPLCFIYI